ncbi:hypothetical protein BDV25DRAFT_143532 [Aspergillus avenaceus]|uniref:Apple domain-containing protein n=1 Tax=Aspergillus avenaceus TaxID=36643 RepID=A0A5N6TJV8_ASPAV|nr:hypothetical protein BDV25DRAFT_143532 [Aspergillus avenaceus]
MHCPWAYLSWLLYFSSFVTADHHTHYDRLCPGNKPITIGQVVYNTACDRSDQSPSLVRKLGSLSGSTPEQCAEACEHDKDACKYIVWGPGACFHSSASVPTPFNVPGAILLSTVPAFTKTPAELQTEFDNCTTLRTQAEIERDNYKKKVDELTQKIWGPNKLDPTDFQCVAANDGKVITVKDNKYRIHFHDKILQHPNSVEGARDNGIEYDTNWWTRDQSIESCVKICDSMRAKGSSPRCTRVEVNDQGRCFPQRVIDQNKADGQLRRSRSICAAIKI